MIAFVVFRKAWVGLCCIKPSKSLGRVKNASYLFIDNLLLHVSVLHSRQQVLTIHELPSGHFQIEATIRRAAAVISRPPVGHHDALKTHWSRTISALK